MVQPQAFEITDGVRVGRGDKLLLIAGPCQIESREHCLTIARALQEMTRDLPLNLVFKSSFDKANRTSLSGKRGIGMAAGLEVLAAVKRETGLPILTDIHSPEQAAVAAEVCDILQTPAFLCRQTDLLIAAGRTGKTINVKKGQFLAPEDMAHVAAKVASGGTSKVLLCERGTCFGYRDLVVDMRGLVTMASTGWPVIFDATHSVQSMGGSGGASGGDRSLVSPLLRAAVAVGVDGIFVECHDNPDAAPSDGPSMVPLDQMRMLLEQACRIRAAVRS